MQHVHGRVQDERGAALIVALLATMLLTALGVAMVMVSNTETMIANNYRIAQEALYSADAGIEWAVQDLLMVPRWNDILAGSTQSSFIDTTTTPTLPAGGSISLTAMTTSLQSATDTQNAWGANNPVWRLYSYGRVDKMLPTNTVWSTMYIAVWIADDPAETDGNPLADTNGVLTLHAEAFGPGGSRKVIEVTVARTSSTEIERGQIAQRGQEELNQRARKAAVQTPGKAPTEMKMNTGSGGLAVQ
jgi:Tfp pilus assembly protein PilX